MKELLIYAEHISERLNYTTRFVFRKCMGLNVKLTDDPAVFQRYRLPQVSYSSRKLGDSYHIPCCGLLAETGIRRLDAGFRQTPEGPCLFAAGSSSDHPFDILSAVFFMLTRYEEYLDPPCDEYGRYDPASSVAVRHGFIDRPVVDQWIGQLARRLKERFPALEFKESRYSFLPTIDIDNAWAYRNKAWWRRSGGLIRALITGHAGEFLERLRVLAGREDDPFDTYALIREAHNQHQLKLIYFFLTARYGPYDKGIRPGNPHFRKLIHQVQRQDAVGIHPSYRSNSHPDILKKEINVLAEITGRLVTISRQHYLKLSFPETYERLLAAGIEADYSMGYSSLPGFRAGTCKSFRFYNLVKEEETALRILPFQVMDRTLKDHLKLDPEGAVETIGKIIGSVRPVGGTFVSVWHNDSFSEKGEWKGWLNVYMEMIKMANR